jgi:YegS/Rv2252/BmrU family lipid kinase
MSVAIIINPIAGGATAASGRARAESAAALVDRLGEEPDVELTRRPGHAHALARAAAARGARLVLAWGGDGTINEVASALAFGSVPLGIIPAGSGNGLARELGVSRRPERAIEEALAARPRSIDLGELGGRLFVNVAGIGIDAYVASRFGEPGNKRRGFVKYVEATVGALASYQAVDYRITTSAGTARAHAVLVTLANSPQFGNGARIAPGARIDDGLLDLVVVEERSRWRTVCQVPRLFTGTADRIPGCTIRQCDHATIASDRAMTFHVDGEAAAGGTELTARVHPAALQIAVR